MKQEQPQTPQPQPPPSASAGVPAFLSKLWALVGEAPSNQLITWSQVRRALAAAVGRLAPARVRGAVGCAAPPPPFPRQFHRRRRAEPPAPDGNPWPAGGGSAGWWAFHGARGGEAGGEPPASARVERRAENLRTAAWLGRASPAPTRGSAACPLPARPAVRLLWAVAALPARAGLPGRCRFPSPPAAGTWGVRALGPRPGLPMGGLCAGPG